MEKRVRFSDQVEVFDLPVLASHEDTAGAFGADPISLVAGCAQVATSPTTDADSQSCSFHSSGGPGRGSVLRSCMLDKQCKAELSIACQEPHIFAEGRPQHPQEAVKFRPGVLSIKERAQGVGGLRENVRTDGLLISPTQLRISARRQPEGASLCSSFPL